MFSQNYLPDALLLEKKAAAMNAVLWNGDSIIGIFIDKLAVFGAATFRRCMIANPCIDVEAGRAFAFATKSLAKGGG